MHSHARKASLLALLSFLVVPLIGGLSACGGPVSAQPITAPAAVQDASTVVTSYLHIFNAGMLSGDFSALSSVFAPDATLTQSNPKGVTTVEHGLAAIASFYQGLRVKYPNFQWTVESMRSVAPNVVLIYQHAGNAQWLTPGRCVHLFVLQNGKVTTYDWATYYPGHP